MASQVSTLVTCSRVPAQVPKSQHLGNNFKSKLDTRVPGYAGACKVLFDGAGDAQIVSAQDLDELQQWSQVSVGVQAGKQESCLADLRPGHHPFMAARSIGWSLRSARF